MMEGKAIVLEYNTEESKQIETLLTAAMRMADKTFNGGSTRHYVRDCLLPVLSEVGIRLSIDDVRELPVQSRPFGSMTVAEIKQLFCEAFNCDEAINATVVPNGNSIQITAKTRQVLCYKTLSFGKNGHMFASFEDQANDGERADFAQSIDVVAAMRYLESIGIELTN